MVLVTLRQLNNCIIRSELKKYKIGNNGLQPTACSAVSH